MATNNKTELSKIYEVGRGAPKGHFGNIHEEAKSASSLQKESVLEKTAREVGVSPRTIKTKCPAGGLCEFVPAGTILNEAQAFVLGVGPATKICHKCYRSIGS
jgi:hypothetical protein